MPIRILLFAVCFILALAGSARAVELVFWTTEIHEDRLVVIDYLRTAFEVMQDDVTVKVVSVDENELAARLRRAVASGDPPHLVGTGSELLVAMAETGCLDTDAAGRIVRRIGIERFYPGVLHALSLPDGGWYAVPFHGWVQGIWYRADWFEEAGLKPPSTWVDIMAAARRFTDPGKGRYGIILGTAGDHYTAQVFSQIAQANGAAMFGKGGDVIFDRSRMVEALGYYAELARFSPPGHQTWRARDYFLQGRAAMLFYSTFIMDDLALKRVASDSLTGDHFSDLTGAEFDPKLVENVAMAPVIRREKGASYGMVNGFGICRRAGKEEQEAAERFLEFLYRPDHYVTWLHMAPGGMMPVLRDVAVSDLFLADPSGIFRRYGRSKVRDIIQGLDSIRSFGLVDGNRRPEASVVYAEGVISRMVERTLFEGVSPRASAKTATGEIREIVDRLCSGEGGT